MKTEILFNSDTYPIVLVPSDYINDLNYVPSDEDIAELLNINKPIKNSIYGPVKPSKLRRIPRYNYFTLANFIQLPILSVVFFLGSFIPARIFTNSLIEAIFASIILFGFQYILLLGGTFFDFSPDIDYDLEDIPDSEYNELLNNYENELKSYNQKLYDIDQSFKKEMYNYQELIESYKIIPTAQRSLSKLSPKVLPQRYPNSISRGKVDLYFFEQLKKHFNESIYLDMTPIKFMQSYSNNYIPDITLICSETNICIDIEIDEPYSFKTRQPTHYTDSEDEKRNQFFLDINWIVVRFSEMQVVLQTDECINTIKSVQHSLKNGLDHFSTELHPQNRWSYEQSVLWERDKYREYYLTNF